MTCVRSAPRAASAARRDAAQPRQRGRARRSRGSRGGRVAGRTTPSASRPPTNDSQKPGCSSAQGSKRRDRRPPRRAAPATRASAARATAAAVTVASIQTVRCDGHAPAREDGIGEAPRARPPQRAALRRRQRRASAARCAATARRRRAPASQANIVTCRPLMRHQVGDAGVAEQVPVVALDRALVADRERREHAGGARGRRRCASIASRTRWRAARPDAPAAASSRRPRRRVART